VTVGALFRDETAWLTQKALAELFGVGVPAIAKHLKNIFESGELAPEATVSELKWFEPNRHIQYRMNSRKDRIEHGAKSSMIASDLGFPKDSLVSTSAQQPDWNRSPPCTLRGARSTYLYLVIPSDVSSAHRVRIHLHFNAFLRGSAIMVR
jgi:hypothetical protein